MDKIKQSINTPAGAAKLSMIVVISLIILKVAVSLISNSISITAQAADSLLDLFSIGITYIAVRIASIPPDRQHPFGHGKAEGIAALIQAVLVLGAGGYIIYSAVSRIITQTPIEPDEGMLVMGISIVASFLLSRHLLRVAKASGSLAIEASARNISADVYTAGGVLLGLLLVRLTGLVILDPIIALIMAGFVLRAGYLVIKSAFGDLTDYALPPEEEGIVKASIIEHNTQLVTFHAMRTRRSGSERFVDLHLVMPRNLTVAEAHEMCNHLEAEIKAKLLNTSISIHVEPCRGNDCRICSIKVCRIRQN